MTSWTNLNKYIDQVLDCELLRLLSLSLTLFFFSVGSKISQSGRAVSGKRLDTRAGESSNRAHNKQGRLEQGRHAESRQKSESNTISNKGHHQKNDGHRVRIEYSSSGCFENARRSQDQRALVRAMQ